MHTMMIRYQVPQEGVAEVLRAVEATFAALRAQQPKGLRYAYFRRAGEKELFALLELDDGTDNPLLAMPAARELQQTVAKWAVGEPPAPQLFEIVGSYGFPK